MWAPRTWRHHAQKQRGELAALPSRATGKPRVPHPANVTDGEEIVATTANAASQSPSGPLPAAGGCDSTEHGLGLGHIEDPRPYERFLVLLVRGDGSGGPANRLAGVDTEETAQVAEKLIRTIAARQRIARHQVTVHSDRSAQMISGTHRPSPTSTALSGCADHLQTEGVHRQPPRRGRVQRVEVLA